MVARVTVIVGAALVALNASAPAAASQPFFHGKFSESGSFEEPDFCGVAAHVEWSESGTTVIRPVRNSDGQAFYGHTNFVYTEVISTTAGSVTLRIRQVFEEQRATHVQGDIWQFQSLFAGTVTVYDAAGDLLLRGSGVFKGTQEFDTLGDGQPGGQPVPGTVEVILERGRGFDDATFCEAVLPHVT
jgi:hypothetical protein